MVNKNYINMSGSFSQAGFFFQNLIAAQKVLDMLEPGSDIRSITLENYEKGPHIDDIIVESASGSAFYQIKWSAGDDKAFTLNNLISSSDEEKSPLFTQLAEGYSEVSGANNVEIFLYSTKGPGTQRFPKAGLDKSLRELISEFHGPLIEDAAIKALADHPKFDEYTKILPRLQTATGLHDSDFLAFLKSVRFRLSEPGIEAQRERTMHKMQHLGIERGLFETLLTAVVEWSISGEAVRPADVLARLGISDRLLDNVVQNFRIEKEFLVDDPALSAELEAAIDVLPGGFVLLEGPPGSGKSTFLTSFKERSRNVKFTYYCFVPDEMGLGNRRLEKKTFLKSLSLAIVNAFPAEQFERIYSDDYEVKVNDWLARISARGEKVVFIVDGLDHVDKKKDTLDHPITEFLTGNGWPNIFFVISSQYVDAAAPDVRARIMADPHRRLRVGPFTEGRTGEFVRRRGLNPSDDTVKSVHRKSEGIPLYLHYITSLLLELPSNDRSYQKFLETLPALQNQEIDTYHNFLYQDVERDDLAVWILSILAHRHEFTTLETLAQLLAILQVQANRLDLGRVLERYRHLLVLVDAKGFSVFHNSFREFILRKTPHLTEAINAAVVDYYRNDPESDEAYRNYFRHLGNSGGHTEILERCDDEWLERGWKKFRPLDEIASNLNVAWKAAVETGSLKQFVRMAFLEQQFGRVRSNLKWTDNYVPSVFNLKIGKTDEAVRAVWDGELIGVEAAEFYDFVEQYLLITGAPLAERIVRAGLDQLGKRFTVDEANARVKIRAIYDSWSDILRDVEGLTWRNGGEYQDEVETFSDTENRETNRGIFRHAIDGKFLIKDLRSLREIAASADCAEGERTYALWKAIILLLGLGSSGEAVPLLGDLDLTQLPRPAFEELVVALAENGRLDVATEFGKGVHPPPDFEPELLSDEPDYKIKGKVIDLYDRLRVHLLQHPDERGVLELRTVPLPAPTRNFLTAMIALASLWRDSIATEQVSAREKTDRLKGLLSELHVDAALRRRAFRDRATGEHFLRIDVHRVFAHVFRSAADILPAGHLAEVVEHWLTLDGGPNSYTNVNSSIIFARRIAEKNETRSAHLVKKLLDRAESQARLDEETPQLLQALTLCAEGFGQCGLTKDAGRLREELFFVACGVGDRKDYQFSEVRAAIERAHETTPEKSVSRLIDQLTLVHQMIEAADGRAVGHAIRELIDFSAVISPALALELLFRVQDHVHTDPAVRQLAGTISKITGTDLRYQWALVKTMGKWEDFQGYNDDTFPALKEFFRIAMDSEDEALAAEVYAYARQQLFVEKGRPEKIYEFAVEAVDRGCRFGNLETDRSDYKEPWSAAERAKERNNGISRLVERRQKFPMPDYDQLKELSDSDFDAFERSIAIVKAKRRRRSLKDAVKREFRELRQRFEDLVAAGKLPAPANPAVERLLSRSYTKFVRNFEELAEVADEEIFETKVEEAFEMLLNDAATILDCPEIREAILSRFNYERSVKDLAARNAPRREELDDEFQKEHLPKLIALAKLGDLPKWERIVRENSDYYRRREQLLALAERFAEFDPAHAQELLRETVLPSERMFFSSSPESMRNHFGLFFRLNPDLAKRTMLEAFYGEYKEFPERLIYHLDGVLQFSNQFDEPGINEYAYGQYERYNSLLARGLANKGFDFEWIRAFPLDGKFEDAVVLYLVRQFDHPEVEQRRLALASLFDLVKCAPQVLSKCLELAQSESENIKEHALSLVFSAALLDHELVMPLKTELLALLGCGHFNIEQTVKEILLHCKEKGAELTPFELTRIGSTNERPVIPVPVVEEGHLFPGRQFVPSQYQTTILYNLEERNGLNDDLVPKVYTRLQNLGYDGLSGMDVEMATHRSHNMNTNFDRIEINGKYFQDTQKVLNETFTKEIKQQAYRNTDIQALKNLFRLYDPADVLDLPVGKPSEIDWLGPLSMGENHFCEFADIDQIADALRARNEGEWFTLYEDGDQRPNSDERVYRTVYFRLISILVDASIHNGTDDDLLRRITSAKGQMAPTTQNVYRHELLGKFPKTLESPVDGVCPVIGQSITRFRGQHTLGIATVLPSIIDQLGVVPEDDISLNFRNDRGRVLEFLNWQERFAGSGRRRMKPVSKGVWLRARREEFSDYLSATNQTLYYLISLGRTTDMEKEEEDMNFDERTHFMRAMK